MSKIRGRLAQMNRRETEQLKADRAELLAMLIICRDALNAAGSYSPDELDQLIARMVRP